MSRPAGALRERAGAGRIPSDPGYLRDLFDRAAWFYDPVNLVTSMGQVTMWRKEVAAVAAPRYGDRVLDAFAGTGGLAIEVLPRLGAEGELVLVDLSAGMLHRASRRIGVRSAAQGERRPRVRYVVGDLLRDDLGLGLFDVVLLGWGLRYVPDVPQALSRVRGFVRPGGRLVVLEFTRPRKLGWAWPAQWYFRQVVPRLGPLLAGDDELHHYLGASSAAFPDAAALAGLVRGTGLTVTEVRSHLGGLVTVVAAHAATGQVE